MFLLLLLFKQVVPDGSRTPQKDSNFVSKAMEYMFGWWRNFQVRIINCSNDTTGKGILLGFFIEFPFFLASEIFLKELANLFIS